MQEVRTKADQVTEALDALMAHGVELSEILSRFKASDVEDATKEFIAKERGILKGNILKVIENK